MLQQQDVPALARVGVAIDEDLLQRFDVSIERRGYANRSEAIRDLIRADLVNEAVQSPATEVAGTITLLYDHHVRSLHERLTTLQHEFHGVIVSTLHVHLDPDNCLEVIVVRGSSHDAQMIADRLISIKGVKHGRLVVTATGRGL
jgi:CopG family nickel-responsive transcriptional regulator